MFVRFLSFIHISLTSLIELTHKNCYGLEFCGVWQCMKMIENSFMKIVGSSIFIYAPIFFNYCSWKSSVESQKGAIIIDFVQQKCPSGSQLTKYLHELLHSWFKGMMMAWAHGACDNPEYPGQSAHLNG